MFRNFLILILLNGCCQSATIPEIQTKQLDNNNIGNALSELAKSCENSFLATQINSKVQECITLSKPQLKFKCLIFYDINRKLCGTTSATDTNIEKDYASYRKKPQDLLELCTGATAWNLSDSLVSASYKLAAESIFHKATRCVKLCETDDIMSTDVDFFCDYYNWGTNLLNAMKQLSKIEATVHNGANQIVTSTQLTKKDDISSAGIEEKPIIRDSVAHSEDQKTNSTQTKIDAVDATKSISKMPMNQETLTLTNVEINTKTQDTAALSQARTNDDKAPAVKPEIEPSVEPVGTSGVGAGMKSEPEDTPIKDNDAKGEQVMNKPETDQKPDTSKLKPQPLDDEYQGFQDSEEGKEGLPDVQTGDDEDPDLADADGKASQVIDKPTVREKTVEQQEFVPQKDIGVSSFPDGYSYEDDDHFFSFFLTAIIVVVVLYVLYHNKSKVTKVVMGLIVEGRQPGRRRNSRGHAYKRLDTLEQAMTAKSSTPPSKIIY